MIVTPEDYKVYSALGEPVLVRVPEHFAMPSYNVGTVVRFDRLTSRADVALLEPQTVLRSLKYDADLEGANSWCYKSDIKMKEITEKVKAKAPKQDATEASGAA